MSKKIFIYLFFYIGLPGLCAGAVPSAWEYFQTFESKDKGLVCVRLSDKLLDKAHFSLKDLRLFDSSGQETPYVIEWPQKQAQAWLQAKIKNSALQKNKTIVSVGIKSTRAYDAIELQTPARAFIKSVTVSGSSDNKTWRVLAKNAPVFHQANGAGSQRIEITPSQYPLLRIVIDDQNAPPVPVTGIQVHLVSSSYALVEKQTLEWKAQEVGMETTHLDIQLLNRHVFVQDVLLTVNTPLYKRRVQVFVPQVHGNETVRQKIVESAVYRVPAEEGKSHEWNQVDIEQRLRSNRFYLTLHNQDSPPLALEQIKVRTVPVFLAFYAQQEQYALAFGNPVAEAPVYDLKKTKIKAGQKNTTPLKAGPVQKNLLFKKPKILPAVQEVGGVIQTEDWTYASPVKLGEGDVHELELTPFVLAHARPLLQDLRLIADNRQVPYLLERLPYKRRMSLNAVPMHVKNKPSLSRWTLTLPYDHMPVKSLTAKGPDALFQRQIHVYEEVKDSRGQKHRSALGSAQWRSAAMKSGTHERVYQVSLVRSPVTRTLYLETDHGDNQAIEFTDFQITYPVVRLVFKTSQPHVFLCYGNPKASQPQYDIALAAQSLLSAEKSMAVLQAEEEVKTSSWWTFAEPSKAMRAVFWVVMILVVLGLLFVIAKLLPETK